MFNIFLNKETKYLFTVLIYSFNAAKRLSPAIKSVLWQTCRDYECFILDDGSDDDTREALADFSGQARLKIHRFTASHGRAYCFNYAIIRSFGRFITFLDSADLWLPTRLEEFEKAIKRSPETGFWYSDAYAWRRNCLAGTYFASGGEVAPEGAVVKFQPGTENVSYSLSNAAVDREAFNRAGLLLGQLRELPVEEGFARIFAGGTSAGAIKAPLSVCGFFAQEERSDYDRYLEEAVIVLKSWKAAPDAGKNCMERLMRKTAVRLIKKGKTSEAREFLKRHSGKRDFEFLLILSATFLPSLFSVFLRGFESGTASGTSGGKTDAVSVSQVETLVRSIT